MKFSILQHPQRSPEWFAARAGRVTGTGASGVVATIKSGEAAARRDLRVKLALERLTGQVDDDDISHLPAVAHGIEREPFARMALESQLGIIVNETGFISADELMVGCSLDGSIDGMSEIVEIKCPKSATHIGYLDSGALPAAYVPQVTHNLLVTGARACHFVSFDDRLPAKLQLVHIVVKTSDLDIEGYEKKLLAFLAEVEDLYQSLKRRAA